MSQSLLKVSANFQTQLAAASAVGATSLTFASVTDADGTALPSGTYGFTIDEGTSTEEHFTGVLTTTNTTIASVSHVTRTTAAATSGLNTAHRLGAIVKITDHPVIRRILNVLDGTTNLDSGTPLAYDGTVTPTTANQLAPKSYVDLVGTGSATYDQEIIGGTAGETLAAGKIVYFKEADARWWLADADLSATFSELQLGIAQGTAIAGAAVSVLISGLDRNQAGLTPGTKYYLSNTAGAISATPGTNTVFLGWAAEATKLLFVSRQIDLPTAGEKDALAGTSGSPSSTNKYVTNDDTSTVGASGKVVRLNGTAYPAADGSAITGVAAGKVSLTASGNIAQNDSVYVSAANTAKTLYPSAMGTGAAITTSASTTSGSTKLFPLSTDDRILYFNGGSNNTVAASLVAQVRTLNAAETDLSNGSEVILYNTGNGSRRFNVAQIDTDKFMVIFHAQTGGVAAGIKVMVVTVSGTTVTAGAVTTIEATGVVDNRDIGVAKVDTDKAAIFYIKDSDDDLYAQILTVSGTTITTNTPVSVKVGSGNWKVSAAQLSTNNVIVVYQSGTTGTLFAKTVSVSGTVPTPGAEQTLAGSANYMFDVFGVSSTKTLLCYSESSNPTNDQASLLTISGATVTKGSDLALAANNNTRDFGAAVIGTSYALVGDYTNSTTMKLTFMDISGSAPTSIGTQNLSSSDGSNLHNGIGIAKITPWTYVFAGGGLADADYIVKLTPSSSARIGLAESAISNAASGNILYRYQAQILSGITLTAGSLYYVDDTGQPTASASLTAPTLGIAISTTKILLQ